jgi:iron complex transport system substrate-binding protein
VRTGQIFEIKSADILQPGPAALDRRGGAAAPAHFHGSGARCMAECSCAAGRNGSGLLGVWHGWGCCAGPQAASGHASRCDDRPGPHGAARLKPPQRIVSLLPVPDRDGVAPCGQCEQLGGPGPVFQLAGFGQGLAARRAAAWTPASRAVRGAASPDVVLMAAGSARGGERLQALGTCPCAAPRATQTHADALRVLAAAVAQALLGGAADSRHACGAASTSGCGRRRSPGSAPLRAKGWRVYFRGARPAPYGASESSFMGETLKRMGVGNILPASMGPFPQVNPEWVVQARPDVIMAGDSSRASMAQRPGWGRLRAMQGDRLCIFKPEESDMLVRAGPRMAEGARLMAGCLNRAAAQGDLAAKPAASGAQR